MYEMYMIHKLTFFSRRRPGASATVVQDAQIARDVGQGWLSRNKWRVLFGTIMLYIMAARVLGDGEVTAV